MNCMERKKYEYRIAGRALAKEQMDIFNLVFLTEDAKLNKWNKKHYGNPATSEERLFGAFDGDKLIGINGFLEMPYIYKGQKLRLIQSCDTAVDPAYRGQGIFTSMINSAEKQFKEDGYDAMIGFTNGNSHPGFMKMGWTDMHRNNKLFMPVNIPAVYYNLKSVKLPRICNLASFFIWRAVFLYSLKGRDFVIDKRNTFTVADYHQFVDTNSIYFDADQAMLDWKLEDLDCLYTVKKNGKEIAWFVVSSYDYADGMKRANIILSNGTEGQEENYAIGLAKVMMDLKAKYDLICFWQPYEDYKKIAVKKVGFLGNVVATEGSPFIVKILTDDPQKIEILKNPGNWRPTQLETDTMICLDK